MCMYSLHGRRGTTMRNARTKETLTSGEFHGHGAFRTTDNKVACIKHETMLVISKLKLRKDYVDHFTFNLWDGKENVTVTVIDGQSVHGVFGRRYAADMLRMANGNLITLLAIAPGVTAVIPRKIRKDAGQKKPRNLSKVLGLDQIKADIPVTKKVKA